MTPEKRSRTHTAQAMSQRPSPVAARMGSQDRRVKYAFVVRKSCDARRVFAPATDAVESEGRRNPKRRHASTPAHTSFTYRPLAPEPRLGLPA